MPQQSPEQYLQQLEQNLARTKNSIAAAKTLLKKQNDQNDIYRKITIGGFLLDHATKSEQTRKTIQTIIDQLKKPQDIQAFKNWELPPVKARKPNT